MLALDFLSLLLTKENPTHAGMSLSPALRELVGVGVLGTDKLAKPHMTEARLQDHKTVATGWKLADIDKNVESLLTSASRLQKEMTVEAKYWAEVLAVSNKGWTITRVPNELQNLGVRYGFSEAASDFRATSLAPMRRSEDGSVDLDCGAILGESKRLLVTIERNGNIVGRSSLPKPLSPGAPLEDRVLEARNTIIAQELWHEMNREGRLLLTYGVRLEEDALSYSPGRDMRIIFTMQSLEAGLDEESSRWLPEDYRAEAISATLHQVLTYAHRTNSKRRLRTNPKTRYQTAKTFPYQLLRPVLAYMQHEESVEETTRFISGLTTVLQSAGITTAMFKLTEPPVSPNEMGPNSSPPEALLQSLLPPLKCQFELNITPEARVSLLCRTSTTTFISTGFNISLPSLAPGQPNLLQALYPPGERSNFEGYLLPDLKYYLQQAVARVVLEQASRVVQQIGLATTPPRDGSAKSNWIKDIGGTALINLDENHDGEERIDIDVVVRDVHATGLDTVEDQKVHIQPQLCIEARWTAGQPNAGLGQQTWSWTLSNAVQGIKQEPIEQVIRNVVTREAGDTMQV